MKWIILLIQAIAGFVGRVRDCIRKFDTRMHERYEPLSLTFLVLAAIGAIMVVLLFVPPYQGLSNDGSFDYVLADVGLAQLDPSDPSAYFSYYEREWRIDPNPDAPGTTPLLLKLLARFAVLVDRVLTRDGIFDLRFLALIYVVLYLTVLFPVVRYMLSHVRTYSSGLFLSVVLVLVFADATVVTRFASFYSQPLEWLLMLALLDAGILMSQKGGTLLNTLVMAGSALMLMNVNRYCALAGMVYSLLFWMLALKDKGSFQRVGYVITAMILVAGSVFSVGRMLDLQSPAEKYDQMTRGVLFEAENPEKALSEFGIDPRYSLLSKSYTNQSFPVVNTNNGLLNEDFLSKWNTADICLYYAKHPIAAISLLDNGIHTAFTLQSDHSGNFERSVGLPPMAKSLFPTLWSTFKAQSAPRTIGVIVVILGLLIIITRRRKDERLDDDEVRRRFLTSTNFYIYVTFSLIELMTVIVMSGDSQLIRESSLMGGTIDIMFLWLLASLLKKSGQYEERK